MNGTNKQLQSLSGIDSHKVTDDEVITLEDVKGTLQWNLPIKATLGPASLSFVERVSSYQMIKYCRAINIWCWEECPLYRGLSVHY